MVKLKKNVKKGLKKASKIKTSNKHFSKQQKKGKFRKRNKKINAKKASLLQNEANNNVDDGGHESVDELDVTDMIDEEVWESFANNAKQRKKRKLDELEEYEKQPRFSEDFSSDSRMPLLPIKNKAGIVERFKEVDEDEEVPDEPLEMDTTKKKFKKGKINKDAPLPPQKPKSVVEMLYQREEKIFTLKQRIANLCNVIMANPQENVARFRDLLLILDERDCDIFLTAKKLTMVSVMLVFKDAIPGYRIRSLSEKESKQKMKKDMKHLVQFEESFLRYYQRFLQKLDHRLRVLKKKNPETSGVKLATVAVHCLCQLLVTHPHFNFRANIITSLIPLMAHPNKKISDSCCEAIKHVYKHDKNGEASLEACRGTAKFIKFKNFKVPAKVLDTFIVIRLKELENEQDEKPRKLTHKEKLQSMSRKEFKKDKQKKQLEKDMEETEAQENTKTRLKHQTEILKHLFAIYFRVLKSSPNSDLLAAVLEGLARFAHLINVDFFDDLVNVLHELISSETLNYRQGLHCVQVVFTILSGQGEALNIDPVRFYTHLYNTFLHMRVGSDDKDFPLTLDCLDIMINKRWKKISLQRVLAFIKRICTIALQLSHNAALAFLMTTWTCMASHKRAEVLLDTDNSTGTGVFLAELQEPEYCNAQATTLWELISLQRHYHPHVKKLAELIAHKEKHPTLPAEFSRKAPVNLLTAYSSSLGAFNPTLNSQFKPLTARAKKVNKYTKSLWLDNLKSQVQDFPSAQDISFADSIVCETK